MLDHVALSLTLGTDNSDLKENCVALVFPNSISALKKFSALFHEENFFEEIELL